MPELGANEPRLLHALPGRLRAHLPSGYVADRLSIERRVCQAPGVRSVAANPRTGNILIHFDPNRTDAPSLLSFLRNNSQTTAELEEEARPIPTAEEAADHLQHVYLPVRGLDRDPRVARRALARLRQLFGVRAEPSLLTGRIAVDYDDRRVNFHELLARVAEVELPGLPGEDLPAHPLDRTPLLHAASRTVGATFGLGMLLLRRWLGWAQPARWTWSAAVAADALGLVRSFPFSRNGLRRSLGRHTTDLLFSAAGIVALTVAEGPLGLLVTGVEGYLLLREVLARRGAWRRYEAGLAVAAAEPGAVIRLGPGEAAPLAAHVIEGAGTALGRDGLPRPLAPGDHVSAGARIVGGPLVLQLEGGRPFLPQPRPAPLAPSLYTRYLSIIDPLAFAYAALVAVGTRSAARALQALLSVNPRTAIIGMEAANLDAARRVLRDGVMVIGTRPRRAVRRPDVLLLDGPRLLTDGLEIAGVVPLEESLSPTELLALAGGVSAAAGSPWGPVFPRREGVSARSGSFNGLWAAALLRGVRYTLGPPEELPDVPGAARMLHEGGYLLELTLEGIAPLALMALRPRLSPAATRLVESCRRWGIRLEMLSGGAPEAAKGVARRAGVALAAETDPAALIRERQRSGALVAFVSDSAQAAPAFADCDLAIGLAWGERRRFPARADLLAADLGGVAAILEAGARRDRAVRDGVWCSAAANLAGALGVRGGAGGVGASRAVYVAALAALADGWLRLRGLST